MAVDRTGSLAPGGRPRGAPVRSNVVATGDRDDTCLLCAADRITPWYHEDDVLGGRLRDLRHAHGRAALARHRAVPPTSTTCSAARHRRRQGVRRPLPRRQHAEHPRPLPHARPPRGRLLRARVFRDTRSGPCDGAGGPPAGAVPGGAGPTRRLIRRGAAHPGRRARTAPVNLFDAVGSRSSTALVERFYRGVEADAVLRPMYPDLTGPKRHLALFLGQYWGGRPRTPDERGHPRLRMRHVSS